jgi:LacI family transcriptional regulator
MTVRIVDVAAASGVSISTVSKALADRPEISSATRRRVREMADMMGYRANGAARRLRSGTTHTVGLLTLDSLGRWNMPVLLGVEDAFGSERMSVLLCDARGDSIRARHHLQTLLEHGVDGIVALADSTNDRPSLGHDMGVPVVYAYGPSADPRDYSVIPDDAHGAVLAVSHLLDLGRHRVGHITGPSSYEAANTRAHATQEFLAASGLSLAGGRVYGGEWSEQWGRIAVDLLLRDAPETDAIFCGNDNIARGVCEILRDRGIRVPEDVAVIGFDNWDVVVSSSRPPLSSIDMVLEEVGRTAARALFSAINGDPIAGVHRLPCRLVMRESTTGGR